MIADLRAQALVETTVAPEPQPPNVLWTDQPSSERSEAALADAAEGTPVEELVDDAKATFEFETPEKDEEADAGGKPEVETDALV